MWCKIDMYTSYKQKMWNDCPQFGLSQVRDGTSPFKRSE